MKVKVDGETRDYRAVWLEGKTVKMIDQSILPFTFRIIEASSCQEIAKAILRHGNKRSPHDQRSRSIRHRADMLKLPRELTGQATLSS
jgi:hypothetical protein